MKSIVSRALRTSNTRRKSTTDEQTLQAKRTSTPDNTYNAEDMCQNPLYSPKRSSETQNTFVCSVCETAMHFRTVNSRFFRCSICEKSEYFKGIQLTCDTCELSICCVDTRFSGGETQLNLSCYSSYFDPIEPVREELYHKDVQVAKYQPFNQKRWLQCMWHDIVHNMDRFRVELLHVSRADRFSVGRFSTRNIHSVIDRLGTELTESLIRLFVIFQNRFDSELVHWFSSIIQHDPRTFGFVALKASVSLKGRLEQVKWLMHNLQLNVSNCYLSTIFGSAAENGRSEIVEYLLEAGSVNPSADNNHAIRWASRYGHSDVVERLLQDDRVDPTADNNYSFLWASLQGHLPVVERLLQDARVDPSADIQLAFRGASRNGHLSIVERLLEDDRVDPSAEDNYAIRFASWNGNLTVVERLLQDDRVDPTANENFAIQTASAKGHLKVAERLLQDDRVDPSANNWKAMKVARDNQTRECLYNHSRIVVCFAVSEVQLMKQLMYLHNESLIMGGHCLNSIKSDTLQQHIGLPQDIVYVILSEWATLVRK